MKYVHLGRSNLVVSEFCLGTMMLGGKTSPEEATRIIARAVDAGVNFMDTANSYTGSRSEEIVGQALQGMRDRVVLATKVSNRMGEGPNDLGISRFHLVRAVEASLRRLATDRIDLYYVHWPQKAMDVEEMVRALEDLVHQGKILYTAVSNFPAWLMTRTMWQQDALGCARIAAGQYGYNLIEREIEVEVLPAAAALGVGIVTYRPLAAGALTGKYLDGVPSGSRGASDDRLVTWSEAHREGLTLLAEMARERGLTPADGAIAWVRGHHAVTAPIVGVSTLEQLEANLRGFDWELSPEERETLSKAFAGAAEEPVGNFGRWRRAFDMVRS